MQQFFQTLVAGLAQGSIYGSLALALVLIYKATEVINFAQGQFLVFGAFMVYNANQTWGLPWPLAVMVGIATGVVLGVAVERLILRSDGGWVAVYYDSPDTLAPKLELANERGLAGAGFWAVGYERGLPGYTELIGRFAAGKALGGE